MSDNDYENTENWLGQKPTKQDRMKANLSGLLVLLMIYVIIPLTIGGILLAITWIGVWISEILS